MSASYHLTPVGIRQEESDDHSVILSTFWRSVFWMSTLEHSTKDTNLLPTYRRGDQIGRILSIPRLRVYFGQFLENYRNRPKFLDYFLQRCWKSLGR
jgi:hypothetical protein